MDKLQIIIANFRLTKPKTPSQLLATLKIRAHKLEVIKGIPTMKHIFLYIWLKRNGKWGANSVGQFYMAKHSHPTIT